MFTLLPLSRIALLHTCANCNSWETQTDGRHAYYMIITLQKLPLMQFKLSWKVSKNDLNQFREKKSKPQFLVWKFVKIIWLTRKICRICRTPEPPWRAHFSSNPAGQSSENSNKALIRQTCLWGGRIGSHRKVLCKTTNLLLLVHIEASNASFPWNEYHTIEKQ